MGLKFRATAAAQAGSGRRRADVARRSAAASLLDRGRPHGAQRRSWRSPSDAAVQGDPGTLGWGTSEPSALLEAAREASPLRHVVLFLAAGLVTAAGQWLLTRLTSGNGIEITAGDLVPGRPRCPGHAHERSGSAVLSIVIVGMGASCSVAKAARNRSAGSSATCFRALRGCRTSSAA